MKKTQDDRRRSAVYGQFIRNLHLISLLYLILPFLLFLFGWMRLAFAIPISIILLFALWRLLKNTNSNQLPNFRSLTTVYCLLITATWVFLSGVGGYSFQNWDQHWRNAVLRDLITYNWPVIYSSPEQGPIKMLVYYVLIFIKTHCFLIFYSLSGIFFIS